MNKPEHGAQAAGNEQNEPSGLAHRPLYMRIADEFG